tara:strand:- start:167 stop:955 length:789 start_codon:yes stop_codon:yes gene_type:complete
MFIDGEEKKISEEYLNQGFVVKNIDNPKALDEIKKYFINYFKEILSNNKQIKKVDIFDSIHKYISVSELNEFRLNIINKINSNNKFRENFFKVSKTLVEAVVGNEIAMQLKINLSIQLPNDDSSLLPVHADTWSGLSPFETVIWLPLVDCYKTKSMYILPPKKNEEFKDLFMSNNIKKSDDIFKKIKKDLIWLNVKYGQVVIFDQSLPHGNVVNKESETRWSMNCRFKSIFTPYSDKRIGEFYEPITLKPASKRGFKYKFPK